MKRYRFPAAIAVLAALVVAMPAAAAPPPNDTSAGAVTISGDQFLATVDTTEATTDAEDAAANALCGAPATEASVWYTLTAGPTGANRSFDVSSPDYDAWVILLVEIDGDFVFAGCSPGGIGFNTEPGSTLYFLVVDATPGVTNGGTLTVFSRDLSTPPQAQVTIDSAGTLDTRTGVATITGTLTCSNASEATMHVTVRQQAGAVSIEGAAFLGPFSPCDGQPHAWSAEVSSPAPKFKKGPATVSTLSITCDEFQCEGGEATQTVELHR